MATTRSNARIVILLGTLLSNACAQGDRIKLVESDSLHANLDASTEDEPGAAGNSGLNNGAAANAGASSNNAGASNNPGGDNGDPDAGAIEGDASAAGPSGGTASLGGAGSAAGGSGGSAGGNQNSAGAGGASGSSGSSGAAGAEPGPSCSDQVSNQAEEDIDCGGPCPSCLLVDGGVPGDAGAGSGSQWFTLNRVILGSTPTTAQVLVSWNDQYLRARFEVTDTTPHSDSATYWEDDSVEIYIDVNNAKSGTFQADDFQVQAELNSSAAAGLGAAIWAALSVTQSQSPSGTIIEVTVPWTGLGTTGAAVLGTTIGFDLAVNDDSNGGSREAQLMLTGGDQNFNNPSLWGVLTLSPG